LAEVAADNLIEKLESGIMGLEVFPYSCSFVFDGQKVASILEHEKRGGARSVKSPKLFWFRRVALLMAAAMLVAFWPALPPAFADSGLMKIHVDQPSALAVNPATNEIYVASAADNTLTVIDGLTGTVSRVVNVGLAPSAVAVDPATGKVYVACHESDELTVFDEGSGSVSSFSVGAGPVAVAVDQAANKIYLVNDGSSDVTVVDGVTDSVSTIQASFTLPRALAVNDSTGMVYVVAGLNVYEIDPKAGVSTTIASGQLPRGMAIDQATGLIYVADWGGNDVLAINNNAGASQITVGKHPIDVAIDQATGQIYAADAGSNDLAVIEGSQTTNIGLDSQPIAVAVNQTTGQVYVISQVGDSLTVIDRNAAAASAASGVSSPGSASTTTPAQQTVITLDIGKTAYTVNGAVYEMDAAPFLSGGRTLLPISYVATALGATVDWNAAEQMVTVALNSKTLELWIGKSAAMVNGVSMPIDSDNPGVTPILAPPGRAMLPLRFISENLGCQVVWNPSLQEVTLTGPSL
jgi:YVTN family beta-propeller protein